MSDPQQPEKSKKNPLNTGTIRKSWEGYANTNEATHLDSGRSSTPPKEKKKQG